MYLQVLLDLVDNQEMTEEEVGQRILTALKKVNLAFKKNRLSTNGSGELKKIK